jgi:hypothetical protein
LKRGAIINLISKSYGKRYRRKERKEETKESKDKIKPTKKPPLGGFLVASGFRVYMLQSRYMNFIKFIRIFLLVLIVIGIGLLATQKFWVPKVVYMILKTDGNQIQQATSVAANGEELYYAKDGKIFVFNTSNSTTKLLTGLPNVTSIRSLTFSEDGRHLLFTGYIDNESSILYDYDFETKKTTNLYSGPYLTATFSPNGKYVLAEGGGYVGDGKIAIINLETKDKIADGYARTIRWSPDGKKYALQAAEIDLNNSTGEHQTINSVFVTAVESDNIQYTNRPTIGNLGSSYELIRWIDNDTFVYKQIVFDPPFLPKDQHSKNDSERKYWQNHYQNSKKLYFSINVKTLEKKEVKEQEITYPKYDPNTELLSPLKDWKIDRVDEDEMDVSHYYVVRLSDKLRVKLDDNITTAWRPIK